MQGRFARAILLGALCALVVFGALRWRYRAAEAPAAGAQDAPALSNGGPAVEEGTVREGLPQGSIAGRITDLSARPLAFATVCIASPLARPNLPSPIAPRCTAAGEDGRYRFDALAPASYTVDASAPEHQPARWRDDAHDAMFVQLEAGAAREGIDLALSPGGVRVRGRVKDVGGGIVVGATVMVQPGGSEESGGAVVQSNAQGEWQATIPSGNVYVRATAVGYARGDASGVAPGTFIEVVLEPEAVLEGRVVEAGTETPVSGVRVHAGSNPQGVLEGSDGEGEGMAFTNAEGRFRIPGLRSGRYKPLATSARHWGVARESVFVGVGETEQVRIEVSPAFSVSGRVQFPDGRGCSDGSVRLEDPATQQSRSGRTAPDGSVRIEGLSPGTYEVDVNCFFQGLSEDAYEPLKIGTQSVSGLVWKVKTGLTVRGQVVDSAGQPAGGTRILARPKEGAGFTSSPGAAEARPDGTFRMAGLVAGTYFLEADGKGASRTKDPVEVKVERDVDGVRIALAPPSRIEGTVVDARGAPVSAVEVTAEPLQPESNRPLRYGQGSTRDDGTFTLDGLDPAEYAVTVAGGFDGAPRAPGAKEDARDPRRVRVTVRAGETAKVKLVAPRHQGTIQGRVVGEAGEPLSDLFVEAAREMDKAENAPPGAGPDLRFVVGDGPGRGPARTDLEGRFTLGSLPPGSYSVRAYREYGVEAVTPHVPLGAKVTITMRATGSISGVVATASGGSPERFVIGVSDPKVHFMRSEGFFRTGGTWTLHDVPAGTFDISVDTAEGRATGKVTLAQGEKRQGVRLTLAGQASVRGRFVALETGEPVAGMIATISPAEEGFSMGSSFSLKGRDAKRMSDAAGWFEIEHAPSGRVYLHGFSKMFEGDHASVMVPLTLEAGKTNEPLPIRVVRSRVKGIPADIGFQPRGMLPGSDSAPPAPNVVGGVTPGGPAAKAGLVTGDEIVSVDGYDVVGPNSYLLEPLTRVAEGTTIHVTLRRGGTLAIQAEKRALFP
ncbi:carboxypeptidase regulatory-like domain-containing protein [Pendulispora albinea]|uniref:Carboxypeptidase regulatory-like domain-containing protein n=1 Tax=Pendulispora albinea TaxID=2741071 RepID=A0ABZ2M9N7_9BACT